LFRLLAILAIYTFGNSSLSQLSAQADSLQTGFKIFYFASGNKSSEGNLLNGKPEGIWKSYYESGQLKSIGKRTNHQLDSTWIFYDIDGNISSSISYKKGKKDGEKLSFEGGRLILEEHFSNDIKTGVERAFHANGVLRRIAQYENAKLHGMVYEYDSTGVLKELKTYENGVILSLRKVNHLDKRGLKQGLWVKLFENRSIYQEMTYKDNMLDGYLKTFDRKGELQKVEKYVNGVLQDDAKELKALKVTKTYYPGAKVKSKGVFDNNQAIGLHLNYDSLGNIIQASIYEQGILLAQGITDFQNRKQGVWKEYYDDGNIKSEGEYEDDLKIKEWKYYYPSGKIEQRGSFLKGKLTGTWRWYFENGRLLREEVYRNGLEDGISLEYGNEGDTLAYGEYLDGEKEGIWLIRSGDILMKGNYQSGQKNGLWQYIFLDGTIRFSGNYTQGFPDGKHSYYHTNGKIQQEGRYKMGKKDGDWRKFDENGLVIFTVTYKDGIEIKYEGVRIKPGFEPEDYAFIVEDTYF
jgi:antitoxin component YwqK of YwqJK toxin-antitoxin module